jgi:hypothetical protein
MHSPPPSRTPFYVLVVVVVAAGVAAFVGVGNHRGDSVLVVGDSLTAQSSDEIRLTLQAEGWKPTIEGHSGSSIVGGRAGVDWPKRVAQLVIPKAPDVAIVELGTNDHAESASSLASGVDAVMGPLRHVRRVVWLNAQAEALGGADAKVVNEVLREATVRWPNLEILDMSGHFRGHDEWHVSDGVHFNDSGKGELARFVRAALDAPPSRVGALSPAV